MAIDLNQLLSDTALIAARVAGADWPRSMLRRIPVPRGWVGARRSPAGARQFIPAGEQPEIASDDEVILVREQPVALPLEVSALSSQDDYPLRVALRLLVRLPQEADGIVAFAGCLTTSGRLSHAEFAERLLTAGGRNALQAYAAERPAAELLRAPDRDALAQLIRQQLERFCFDFSCALGTIEGVTFHSSRWQAEQAAQTEAATRVAQLEARAQVEQATKAALDRRLEDLGSILERMQSLAAGSQDVGMEALLRALAPSERGRLFEHLWRIMPNRAATEFVAVVAGQACRLLAPRAPHDVRREWSLPEWLGALRSVRFESERDRLLIGAATGVWLVDPSGDTEPQAYAVARADTRPRTGFNSAVLSGGALYGAHSQLGLWRWPLDQPDAGARLVDPEQRGARAVRSVTADGDAVICGIDRDLVRVADDGSVAVLAQVADTIQALAVTARHWVVGTSDGRLLRIDRSTRTPKLVFETHAPIESITARRWQDLDELVIPAGKRGLLGIYGQEGWNTNLLSRNDGVRRATASDDLIVAMTPARDRLWLLHEQAASEPADVPIAQEFGNSIQDFCVITKRIESDA